eukprot:2158981-Alexandrium_andersonii.AAC.1
MRVLGPKGSKRKESAVTVGEIQPLGTVRYQAVAKCFIPGHEKCSRMRAWRMNQGEHPAQVDRALVRWLHDGVGLPSKQEHMACRKY